MNTNIEEWHMSTILALVSEFEGLKFSEDFWNYEHIFKDHVLAQAIFLYLISFQFPGKNTHYHEKSANMCDNQNVDTLWRC